MTHVRHQVHFTIDRVPYVTRDDNQEVAGLLRLSGHDPAQYDLGRIDHEGDEIFFRDSDIVRVRDNDHFVTQRKLHFTIDGVSHTTVDDEQQVSALLRLAGVNPDNHLLARVGAATPLDRDDLVKIHPGDAFVTIKRDNPVA